MWEHPNDVSLSDLERAITLRCDTDVTGITRWIGAFDSTAGGHRLLASSLEELTTALNLGDEREETLVAVRPKPHSACLFVVLEP